MPVRQLSKPSTTASASSTSETMISTVRVLTTEGESSSGAVGSSTMISRSVLDMGLAIEAGGTVSLRAIGSWRGRGRSQSKAMASR